MIFNGIYEIKNQNIYLIEIILARRFPIRLSIVQKIGIEWLYELIYDKEWVYYFLKRSLESGKGLEISMR